MSRPAAPQLCFGEVIHTRLRPALHAFRYGVYFIRLPLRSMGQQDFAARLISRNRFNLLSFRDSDHGDGRQPLTGWIDALLHAHDIRDADGEIWLQTFPRVLGYVFNPVSFWFCHRADGSLRAILCEVSNTFGERHSYLLDATRPVGKNGELQAEKVFHVSPFCPVEGSYRFRFLHGGDLGQRHVARIDYEDNAGPLIQTSVAGTAHPMSDRNLARAFCGYPLMTVGVIAKIHWQALRLWLKRVPFFKKPPPPVSKVSR
jgi:DUF1365 family protein